MEIGIIEQVPVRKVWEREDTHFTPWLSNHLPELQKQLGLLSPISEIETEIDTGDFRADIVGNMGEHKIVIENMFEDSDHGHLGKCITYASMLKARYVVWIAESFRPEHLSAIDWLNDNFTLESGVQFYAVELSAIQITGKDGNVSAPAAQFKVLREPGIENKEEREKIGVEEMSSRYENRKQFWADFIDAYSKINPKWKNFKPTTDNWKSSSAGISGVSFNPSFFGNSRASNPSVGLYIQTPHVERNQKIFDEIMKQKESIEKRWNDISNEKIIWRSPNLGNLKEKTQFRDIRIKSNMEIDFKSASDEEKNKAREWLVENLSNFEKIFAPIIKNLSL